MRSKNGQKRMSKQCQSNVKTVTKNTVKNVSEECQICAKNAFQLVSQNWVKILSKCQKCIGLL